MDQADRGGQGAQGIAAQKVARVNLQGGQNYSQVDQEIHAQELQKVPKNYDQGESAEVQNHALAFHQGSETASTSGGKFKIIFI